MSFYRSSSITPSDPIPLTYGMTCLTSAISFSLEKDEVVSLDCGLFYPISGLHPLNKATMKVHCDIAAGIQVVEYSLRKDDDKSRLLTIESISVCEGVAVDVDDRWFQTDTTYEYLMQQESGVKAISFKRFDNAKDSGWIRVEVLSEFTEPDVPTDVEEDYESDYQVNELERRLSNRCACHSAFGRDDDGNIRHYGMTCPRNS